MFLGGEENIRNVVKHFILRRTKDTAGINLPPVISHNIVVPWSNCAEKNLVEDVHSLIPNISRINQNRELSGISIIVAMLRTRQTCILPSLIEKGLAKLFGPELAHEIQPNIKNYTAKLDCIVDTLHERKNNGKGKIVFCHYRSEIDFIYQKLKSLEIENIYIYDGRNSGPKTMQRILDNAFIVLLQIQTGCEGLNLQEKFSEVYFSSPHWNPFVEDQAVARCHRVGQKNNVDVFKFIMDGFGFNEELQMDTLTLEKYIHAIHERKRNTEQLILSQ
jgi:SNF2 family DNA or RNA helicase